MVCLVKSQVPNFGKRVSTPQFDQWNDISSFLRPPHTSHIAVWVKSGKRGNLKCLKVKFCAHFLSKMLISFVSDAKLLNSYD